MKRYPYKEPWTAPWKVFFDRLRRQDLNWPESLWVCVMVVATLSICGFGILTLLPLIAKVSVALVVAAFGIIGSLVSTSLTLWIWNDTKRRLGKGSYKKIYSELGIPLKIQELRNRPKIKSPPGTRLLSVVEFFYSPKTVEEVFKPLIADWRTEYFDALKQNRTVKARWISARYRYHFAITMGVSRVYALFRSVLSVLSARK